MSNETTALVPYNIEQSVSLVMPLVTPQAAALAVQQYEALKAATIQPKDVYRDGKMEYLKKSFWRRLATFFGLSLVMVVGSERREQDEKGALAYSVFYKAVAPNGRIVEADGYCSRSEPGKQSWPEHSIRATAHTRAKNRAISDMVGGGEVSYEEMHGDGEDEETPRRPAPAPRQIPQRTVTPAPAARTVDGGPTIKTEFKTGDRQTPQTLPKWPEMQKRALAVGVQAGDYLALIAQITGKDRNLTEEDKRPVLDEIERLERAKADAVAKAQATRKPHRVIEETGEVVEDEPLTPDEEAPFPLREPVGEIGA